VIARAVWRRSSGVSDPNTSGMVVPGEVACGSAMNRSRWAGFTREPTAASRGACFDCAFSDPSAA